MKIRFRRNVMVDVQKTRLNETWDHLYQKWEELRVEGVTPNGRYSNIKTSDGDVLMNVPQDAFEVIQETPTPKVVL